MRITILPFQLRNSEPVARSFVQARLIAVDGRAVHVV
jgi:hypothetical protein